MIVTSACTMAFLRYSAYLVGGIRSPAALQRTYHSDNVDMAASRDRGLSRHAEMTLLKHISVA